MTRDQCATTSQLGSLECVCGGHCDDLHDGDALVCVRSADHVDRLLVRAVVQRSTVDRQEPHPRLKMQKGNNKLSGKKR